MPVYPEEVSTAVRSPNYLRTIAHPNSTGTDVKFDCGCYVRFQLEISDVPATIGEVGYQTNGCGFMTAAAERLAAEIDGTLLVELGARLESRLEVDQDRAPCISAAVNALKAAFADHRARKIEEFTGEKALICTCFGVEEEIIEAFVRKVRLTDVNDVTKELKAGGGCGACTVLIREIIDLQET